MLVTVHARACPVDRRYLHVSSSKTRANQENAAWESRLSSFNDVVSYGLCNV